MMLNLNNESHLVSVMLSTVAAIHNFCMFYLVCIVTGSLILVTIFTMFGRGGNITKLYK